MVMRLRPWILIVGLALAGACLPSTNDVDQTWLDGGTPPPAFGGADGGLTAYDASASRAFEAFGLSPSHGPFAGGTRVTLQGRGFIASMQISVGGVTVAANDVVASTAERATFVVPAGTPGPADVKVVRLDSGEERTLVGAFTYDTAYLSPSEGALSGGTRVRIIGSGTAFNPSLRVRIAGSDCTNVEVKGPTEAYCLTPAGTAGAKDVTIETTQSTLSLREAFTYTDGTDAYRGGLSGSALSGTIRALVFNSMTGDPVPGGKVVVGTDAATALIGTTSASGSASITGVVGSKATVTVAAKCFHPITFVDVPVDTVTAFVGPIMTPECMKGDPASMGNYTPRLTGTVQGELIWPDVEFKRGNWYNVPAPVRSTERRVAYVLPASAFANDSFNLPSSTLAVTPESTGSAGYAYKSTFYTGMQNLYALAGIEDRSVDPPKFTPYAMGIARGVVVDAYTPAKHVDIRMTTVLDQALRVSATVPRTTSGAPDHINVQLAVTTAQGAYAPLPLSWRQSALPLASPISFVGIPSLSGDLSSESYALTLVATTHPYDTYPMTALNRILVRDTSSTLNVTGFLPLPSLTDPPLGRWTGGRVAISSTASYELSLLILVSGGGLVQWAVVAPGATPTYVLPDLGQIKDASSLVPGPLQVYTYITRMSPFDYASLRYGQLSTSAWSAYAAILTSSTY